MLGTNQGANAVELLLDALTSCLSMGAAYNATAWDIEIEELRMEVSEDIDLHGFLELSGSVLPGCQTTDVGCHIKSPASDSAIADLLKCAQHTSPRHYDAGCPTRCSYVQRRMTNVTT